MTAIDQDWVRDAIERHSYASGGNGRDFHNGAYAAIADEIAQAIAATLGAEDAYTREDVESAFVSGYSLGCLPVGSDPTWDQNEQTMDEHMAEWGWVRKEAALGSGTCHDKCSRFNAWVCSECGATLLLMFDDYGEPTYSVDGVADVPRFCPNCGRRVE